MWRVTVCTHTKWGKSPRGFHLRIPKRVLFCHQYNVDFQPLILYQFWALLKWKTWIGVRMRKPLKYFRISAQGVLQVPKQLKIFRVGVCDRVTALTAQFLAMGIISGTSRHSTSQGRAFCAWVLVGDVRFGRYKPTKKTNFGDRCRRRFSELWRKSKQTDVGVVCVSK